MNLIELNFKRQLQQIIKDLFDIGLSLEAVHSEKTRLAALGDYTSAVVLMLAKRTGQDKYTIAQRIKDALEDSTKSELIYEAVNISGPGFINVRLAGRIDICKDIMRADKPICTFVNADTSQVYLEKMSKRVTNIVKVLKDEGYATDLETYCTDTMQDAYLPDDMYLRNEWLKLYHYSSVILLTETDMTMAPQVFATIADMKSVFDNIENQVVYRKYTEIELRIIYYIYCQIAYIFDRIKE